LRGQFIQPIKIASGSALICEQSLISEYNLGCGGECQFSCSSHNKFLGKYEDFLMDNGVVTDKVIDTSISHNMGSKLLDNGTFTNNHTTWNNSTRKVPF